MARRSHSLEQIAAALRQVESGIAVTEIARRLGDENTPHLWRKRSAASARRRFASCATCAKRTRGSSAWWPISRWTKHASGHALKKVLKPARRRILVGYLQARYGVSQRRACLATGFWCSSICYRGKRNLANEMLQARIREIAGARVRYGYRRIHVNKRPGVSRIPGSLQSDGFGLAVERPAQELAQQIRRSNLAR